MALPRVDSPILILSHRQGGFVNSKTVNAQIKAARALLGWSQDDPAKRRTFRYRPSRVWKPKAANSAPSRDRRELRRALEKAGIEFTNGKLAGVRVRNKKA